MDVQRLAELGRARLQTAVAALHLAGVEVLQDTEGEQRERGGRLVGGVWGWGEEIQPEGVGGVKGLQHTYMAVMASFWKVTKAMPSGLVWTFSFSFRYSSFSLASRLV